MRTLARALVPLLLTVPLTLPAGPAAASTPPTSPGAGPAISTSPVETEVRVFWRTADDRLAFRLRTGDPGSWADDPVDLGGTLSTGPVAMTRDLGDAITHVLAAGANGAVYFRRHDASTGVWSAWTSVGGFTARRPATGCIEGPSLGQPAVWVVGGDGALWRRLVGWESLGGSLASDPAAVPPVDGECPPQEDVVALGQDGAVWEHRSGAWSRIGGRSSYGPAIVKIPGGSSHLFVVGTDSALWTASRLFNSATWSGFTRIGGSWHSSPAAQYSIGNTELLVTAQGSNTNLYLARRNPFAGPAWSIAAIP